MSFLRHVGKINDRSVAVLWREVPGEPHMALVTYTDTLNRHVHDPMMKCIESEIGQNSKNLADALNRTHTQDGKYILQVLHTEGLIKKVQAQNVIMTPSPNTKIKLDELNKLLDEMELGEAAVKRLAEIDSSQGLQDPQAVAKRMRDQEKVEAAPQGFLGDSAIANNLRQQAERMHREAQGLLAESQRLMKEAAQMEGITLETQTTQPKLETAKKGRGRPKGTTSKATVSA